MENWEYILILATVSSAMEDLLSRSSSDDIPKFWSSYEVLDRN